MPKTAAIPNRARRGERTTRVTARTHLPKQTHGPKDGKIANTKAIHLGTMHHQVDGTTQHQPQAIPQAIPRMIGMGGRTQTIPRATKASTAQEPPKAATGVEVGEVGKPR